MDKSKQLFVKSKKSIRRSSPLIQSGDRIDYKNLNLLLKFLTREGKILSRRVNKLTLKQQRLITIAIKQARILSLLPFVNSSTFLKNAKKKYEKSLQKKKKKDEKSKSITRTPVLKKKKYEKSLQNEKKYEKSIQNEKKIYEKSLQNEKKKDEKSESITRTPVVKKKK